MSFDGCRCMSRPPTAIGPTTIHALQTDLYLLLCTISYMCMLVSDAYDDIVKTPIGMFH